MICPRIGIDFKRNVRSLKKEIFRKSIHVCTCFVPVAAHFYKTPVLILLALAGVLYTVSEILRSHGIKIPLISLITVTAARKRDEGKIVLGPITLVAGVFLSLVLWEEPFAAAGIFALAFGDGLASLAGKTFGKIQVPFTGGKTAVGSLTCFLAIFISSFCILGDTKVSLVLGILGAFIEILPLKDFDNTLIPVLIGGAAQFLML